MLGIHTNDALLAAIRGLVISRIRFERGGSLPNVLMASPRRSIILANPLQVDETYIRTPHSSKSQALRSFPLVRRMKWTLVQKRRLPNALSQL